MDLTPEHHMLLQAVCELQGGDPDKYVGTIAAGLRFRDLLREHATKHGGGWHWTDGDAWHGTSPWTRELVDAGLLDRDVGMAS
jgi:hypothetical protein